MNHRRVVFWLILFLLTLLTAMQFARHAPRLATLTRISTSRLAHLSPFPRSSFSTTAFSRLPAADDDDKSPADDGSSGPKGLPAPPTAEERKKRKDQIDVTGDQGIRFDHLGPIVVNKDGTMSRITNWDKMAAIEKENTLRILGKRNKARMEALKKREEQAEQEGAEVGGKDGL